MTPKPAITFAYCFKDRELLRVKLSLESLAAQTETSFTVIFVDYGSAHTLAAEVRQLVESFPFARYIYNDTCGMVWNRSHALNTAIGIATTPFIFTADIDMIFKPGFVAELNRLADPRKSTFFSAVLLPAGELPGNAAKEAVYPKTTPSAMGWGLIPRQTLHKIGSYDETYCIWGLEDNDIAHRLKMAGLEVHFISDIWMFHYYHPPIPSRRDTIPRNWHEFLKNYFEANQDLLPRNTHRAWGKQLTSDSRPALKALQDDSVPAISMGGGARFFRFALERHLDCMPLGSSLKAVFEDTFPMRYKWGRRSRWAAAINRVLARRSIPVRLTSELESHFEDVYDARDELMYLIVSRGNSIADYAFGISGKKLSLVLIKRCG